MSVDWVSIATFAGGGVGVQAVRVAGHALNARRRRLYPTEVEARRDTIEVVDQNLEIAKAELEMARDVNAMAMETLKAYQGELSTINARVTVMEGKLIASESEQQRLKTLLRHAVSVLRDLLEVAAEHNIPAPVIPDDLKAEIERG